MKDDQLNREIALAIATEQSEVFFDDKLIEEEKQSYSASQLDELRKKGLLFDDFATFFVINKFCQRLNIVDRASDSYLANLFKNARKLDVERFGANPYLKKVKIDHMVKCHDYLLATTTYRKGEILQYDMPDLSTNPPTLKLGFFDDDVTFPAIYQGVVPWMCVCPSEINSMQRGVDNAHGRVLTLGLGLGYFAYLCSAKPDVISVTVVELSKEVVAIFEKKIRPQLNEKFADKITVVTGDAHCYLETVKPDQFDYIYADIWENQQDGAEHYVKIKPYEKRLPNTQFDYWIEKEILLHLDGKI